MAPRLAFSPAAAPPLSLLRGDVNREEQGQEQRPRAGHGGGSGLSLPSFPLRRSGGPSCFCCCTTSFLSAPKQTTKHGHRRCAGTFCAARLAPPQRCGGGLWRRVVFAAARLDGWTSARRGHRRDVRQPRRRLWRRGNLGTAEASRKQQRGARRRPERWRVGASSLRGEETAIEQRASTFRAKRRVSSVGAAASFTCCLGRCDICPTTHIKGRRE